MNTAPQQTRDDSRVAQLQQDLDPTKLPAHVAIIMDGNGRWAKKQGKPRIEGHRAAVHSVRAAVESAVEIGLQALTLYAFSSENWKRPAMEIKALMTLLVEFLHREVREMNASNIRLSTIGRTGELSEKVQKALQKAVEATRHNTGLTLNLALNYGGRNEILDAVKSIICDVQEKRLLSDELTTDVFARYLYTADLPDLDLIVRTSGEMRVSNFLLWQLAYAELYVTPTLWPDFRKVHFYQAVLDFQHRTRRFGDVE
ncbi:isoprenyl transferase [candidate division KSB3 bacterium]|uniref:Isoprenyl transferase n=1 Tax=candidate division KSB3 bacterium TaxID=2044937 RepID=A0A2G6E535_9BACT|nr:MAG: isoprenyl transferase [candidate division KSB3 bacterium]PIE29433.1 MAG: isoprenyl transferase [candidate division KSB3 bacterium]